MHVVTAGSPSATPLVLIHGFGVDHRLLLPLDPVVDAAGSWRRIYPDLPGHGQSPAGATASSEDVAASLHRMIDEHVGAGPFAVLGSSFGGMMARRVAHDRRDQVLGLALLGPVIVPTHGRRDVPPATTLHPDPGLVANLGEAGPAFAEMSVVQTERTATAFITYAHPGLVAADQPALERIAERYALEHEPEQAGAGPFDRPTLIVTGRQDQVVGYRDAWALLEHYPRATFAVLDASGHNINLDQPDLVAPLVTEWLARITREAST